MSGREDGAPVTEGEVLRVENVVVEYPGRGLRSVPFRALNGVSLDIRPGETVGLVGESGSGKTTLGRAILGLAAVQHGRIWFQGREIQDLRSRERRRLADRLQVVFQDPYTSLNPAMTVGAILSEPLEVGGASPHQARARITQLLDQVGLPADTVGRYPREFSGGQRQRIAIARALARGPALIVCDEPVSALDLSTQATVLDLIIEIQQRTGVAYLFVSHDLQVVRHVSHRIAVMHGGEIVEQGSALAVTQSPRHDYTRRLLLASPVSDPDAQRERRAERHRLLAAASTRSDGVR